MNRTDLKVRELDKVQDHAIAQLFGHALYDDPLAMFACPDSSLRAAWLPSSFAAFLEMGHALGEVIGAGDPPVGAAIFRRVLEQHETETPPSGEMHPLDKRLFAQIDAAEHQLHNVSSGPHWFLDVIGVLPEHRGKVSAARSSRPSSQRLETKTFPSSSSHGSLAISLFTGNMDSRLFVKEMGRTMVPIGGVLSGPLLEQAR